MDKKDLMGYWISKQWYNDSIIHLEKKGINLTPPFEKLDKESFTGLYFDSNGDISEFHKNKGIGFCGNLVLTFKTGKIKKNRGAGLTVEIKIKGEGINNFIETTIYTGSLSFDKNKFTLIRKERNLTHIN